MKLGTNYPFGPFEWAEKIGIRYIYQLLKKLEETDPRYKPASLLEAEALT
jgi:3-hydroxybutyryl-CoA dehydrogenase